MAEPGFALTTSWLVAASIEEVAAILCEPERLPEWWPAVYLAVDLLDPGDAHALGRTVAFLTRGWLPYTLRWQARIPASRTAARAGWTIAATGDLAGRGTWTLAQSGDLAAIEYDWRIDVEKPLLKPLTPLLKPVFAANHRWAMARGLEGLQRELVRRRAA